jgi:hypothetical protein
MIECRLTTDHDRNGENGRILLLFFDDPPKTLRQIQQHHCLNLLIHNESSERIKGKDGETMTKIEKRKRTKAHLRTPIPKRQLRTRFSTTTDPISTQEASIHASSQCGRNECPYVGIGLVVLLYMVNVAGRR